MSGEEKGISAAERSTHAKATEERGTGTPPRPYSGTRPRIHSAIRENPRSLTETLDLNALDDDELALERELIHRWLTEHEGTRPLRQQLMVTLARLEDVVRDRTRLRDILLGHRPPSRVVVPQALPMPVPRPQGAPARPLPEQRGTVRPRNLDTLAERIQTILDELVGWDTTLLSIPAQLVATELEDARLSQAQMLSLLNTLKRNGYFDHFFLLLGATRHARLRAVIRSARLPWEYFVNNYRMSSKDVAKFFAGFVVGVGDFYYDALRLLWIFGGVVVGEKEALTECRKMLAGLKALLQHPVAMVERGLDQLEDDLSDHLYHLEFYEAGRIVGLIVISLLTLPAAVRAVKQLGKMFPTAVAETALALRTIAQMTIAQARALREVLGHDLAAFVEFMRDANRLAYESAGVKATKLGPRRATVLMSESVPPELRGPFTLSDTIEDLERLVGGKKISMLKSGRRSRKWGSVARSEALDIAEAGTAIERVKLLEWSSLLGEAFELIRISEFGRHCWTHGWARLIYGSRRYFGKWPGPDGLLVNLKDKIIVVGDITAGPHSMIDDPLARFAGTGGRRKIFHLEKTKRDARLLVDASKTPNFPDELRGFTVYAEDFYHAPPEGASATLTSGRVFIGKTAKKPTHPPIPRRR